MVAEEENRLAIVHRLVFAEVVVVENGRHRRDVLVTEAQVGARESGIAGLDRCDADFAGAVQHMAGKNLFGNGHRPRLGFCRRQEDFALQARNIEGEQSAVLDDLTRDLVFAIGELGEGNFFTAANLVDHAEVGRSQHPKVLAVLLVDAFDILRDDH